MHKHIIMYIYRITIDMSPVGRKKQQNSPAPTLPWANLFENRPGENQWKTHGICRPSNWISIPGISTQFFNWVYVRRVDSGKNVFQKPMAGRCFAIESHRITTDGESIESQQISHSFPIEPMAESQQNSGELFQQMGDFPQLQPQRLRKRAEALARGR